MDDDLNLADNRIIEQSKVKQLFACLAAFVFTALGCWMISLSSKTIEASHRLPSPWLVHGWGYVAILFFGPGIVLTVKRLIKGKPGLVLSASGIHFYHLGSRIGLVQWSEVTSIEVYRVSRHPNLVINVRDPRKYIALGGPMRKVLNQMNFKLCGSPLSISSSHLKISFPELRDLVNQYFMRYGRTSPS